MQHAYYIFAYAVVQYAREVALAARDDNNLPLTHARLAWRLPL